jgi:pimeloyl-ACP methyl ester carboxylesterase
MALLLLHGLGGTGRVWDGVRELAPDALAPDLAGHGTAPRLDGYTYEGWAAELVERLQLDGADPLQVIGHSLGGVVGLELAARGDVDVDLVVGLGIKTSWSDEDLAGLARVADKGVAWFDDAATAVDRHLRTTGLRDVLDPGSAAARAGVAEEGGRWRLAVDPQVHRVDAVDLGALLGRVDTAVVLARGVDDAMSPLEELARHGVPVVEIAGAGHNAHVERPAEVLALLDRAAGAA